MVSLARKAVQNGYRALVHHGQICSTKCTPRSLTDPRVGY